MIWLQKRWLPCFVVWPGVVCILLYQEYVSPDPIKWARVIHFATFALNMELVPRIFKKQFTVSELFVYSSISAYYTYFFADSVIRKHSLAYIPGCNISNILAFYPWAVLNLALVLGFVCYSIKRQPLSPVQSYVVLLAAIAGALAMISPYNDPNTITNYIFEVLGGEMPLLGYMALMLASFFPLIDMFKGDLPNYIQRKSFHFLALLLFMPGIIMSKYSRPRLLMLAFNCVTVFLTLLEAARYAGFLPASVSTWFKEFSDGRERLQGTLIMTHIYLLMGCALPFSASYIVLSGGVFPSEWVQWSTSGVMFLGIGDSAAAILGKRYGFTQWRSISKKTMQGSSFCVWALGGSYYLLNNAIDPYLNYLFLCVVFAAIPTAILEGYTLQYDNLVCSMFFMVAMVFFHTNFM